MPLDPSIPLSVKPIQLQDPLEMFSAIEQVKGQREAAELRRLAAEEARQRGLEAKEERAEKKQLNELYADAVTVDPVNGHISYNRDKLLAKAPPHLVPTLLDQLEKDEVRMNTLIKSGLDLDHARRVWLAEEAPDVIEAQGDPEVWKTTLLRARQTNSIDQATYEREITETDPAKILARAQGWIQRARGKAETERGVVVGQRIVHPVTGQVIYEGPAADDTKHSASWVEWQDHLKAGGKLTFDQFRVQDANLRRSVTNVNTGGQGGLPPRVETTVRGLATAFRGEAAVKRAVTMGEAVSFVNSLNLDTKNPADDQALIYAFAKAMDPESVVREGEYATVAKYAQSWLSQFGFDAMRVLSSNTPILTRQARGNLKNTITSRFNASRGTYDNLVQSYVSQINKATGLDDGRERLTDYGAVFPSDPATTRGTPGAPVRVQPPTGGGSRPAPGPNPWR